jgi:hypothetical protein
MHYQIYGPDPNLDRIEECGPYLLCIRPPSPLTNQEYIIRLCDKTSREVVINVDPPVRVYSMCPCCSGHIRPLLGICWWNMLDYEPFQVKYNDQFVCRWGGKAVMTVQQLPYERASGETQPKCLSHL